MNPIKLFVVDDQSLVRAALGTLLEAQERFEVVGTAGDARAALDAVEETRPDVILLDITMPGLSGIDAIPLLRKRWARAKIVMLTHHEGQTFVDQALKAGAEGYLSKESDPAELGVAIEAVHRGDPYVSPRVSRGLVGQVRGGGPDGPGPPTRIGSLTQREREVFQLLALGHANKEVARDLDISLGTAKKHRENLQRKLGCNSAAELARLAIREGLLEP